MADITNDPPKDGEDDRDDKVGYGKPPRAHRFQPGQSGNQNGRRKDTRNFKTRLRDELETRVTLSVDGKRHTMTKAQLVATQLVNSALKGHLKSIESLIRLSDIMEPPAFASEDTQMLTEEQRKKLESFLSSAEAPDDSGNGEDGNGGSQ